MKGYPKVKAFLVEHGILASDVCAILEISRTTLSRKLNGSGSDFKAREVQTLCHTYGMDANIFFAQNVPTKEFLS